MQTLLFWQAKVDKTEQKELNLPISLVPSESTLEEITKMSAQNERTSATIYQFPVRGRFANPNGYAKQDNALPTASIGSAWYHDDAMKEEQKAKARKH
jgi:hypothetical protein